MTYDPKAQFKTFHEAHYTEFRQVSQRAFFLNAIIHATAIMVRDGATSEQLSGANRLVETLQDLVADKPEVRRLPIKRLDVLDANEETQDAKKTDK